MRLTTQARATYKDMVCSVEREVASLPVAVRGASGLPQIYAHMGHSRTPSACSAISFASSLLSEPISENYPHSEPETDSRGYEIIKDNIRTDNVFTNSVKPESVRSGEVEGEWSSDEESVSSCDTGPSRPQGYLSDDVELDEAATTSLRVIEDVVESDTISHLHLPPTVVELSAEIMSQHSSKTATNIATQESPLINGIIGNTGATEILCSGNKDCDNMGMDKKRIESWVAETQQQFVMKSSSPTENCGVLVRTHSNTSLCSDSCSVIEKPSPNSTPTVSTPVT